MLNVGRTVSTLLIPDDTALPAASGCRDVELLQQASWVELEAERPKACLCIVGLESFNVTNLGC